MEKPKPKESDLYHPVKALLEGQGYEVKGEIGAVDVVAIRGEDEMVLIELKLVFSLALLQQGVARLAISDAVYLAVLKPKGRAIKANLALCRRLGLGLMTVRLRDSFVEVLADPVPYRPRKSVKQKSRLLREFTRREGDPNAGGATRIGLVTSYRQDALKCAAFLAVHGANRGSIVAKTAGVPLATNIMARNHYGWFIKVSRGVYDISPKGIKGLKKWGGVPDTLVPDNMQKP